MSIKKGDPGNDRKMASLWHTSYASRMHIPSAIGNMPWSDGQPTDHMHDLPCQEAKTRGRQCDR